MSKRVGERREIVSERYIQKEIDINMEDEVRRGRTGGEEGGNVDVFLMTLTEREESSGYPALASG